MPIPVHKEHIDEIFLAVILQSMLISNEGEPLAKFKHKHFDLLKQAFFKL